MALSRKRSQSHSVAWAELWAWLALLFSRLNLCSSHQSLPTSHGATCITPSPIYTPKGKPGRKAGVLEDGKHTALWQQSSRGSGKNEEEAAGE